MEDERKLFTAGLNNLIGKIKIGGKKLTGVMIAETIGCSSSTVSGWLSGRSKINHDDIDGVLELIGKDYDELIWEGKKALRLIEYDPEQHKYVPYQEIEAKIKRDIEEKIAKAAANQPERFDATLKKHIEIVKQFSKEKKNMALEANRLLLELDKISITALAKAITAIDEIVQDERKKLKETNPGNLRTGTTGPVS